MTQLIDGIKQSTKKEIRARAKLLGYTVSFKTNPFNPSLVSVGFNYVYNDTKYCTLGANAFSAEFYSQHKKIFELLKLYDKSYLTCSDQKLVI